MIQTFKYILITCAGSVILSMSFIGIARAETHITDSNITNGEYWTESGSPYIIDTTVNIGYGKTLTIGPGVSIISSPLLDGYDIFDVYGKLSLNGLADKRISIKGDSGISIFKGTTTISYTDIFLTNGIQANLGDVFLSSSTISNAYNGIWSLSSKIEIQDSRIDNNKVGIYVSSPVGGIFQANKDFGSVDGIGGIGNAMDEDIILAFNDPIPSQIDITNSSISGNAISSIQNKDTKKVEATRNWWGTDAGPSTVGENMINGLTEYAPWLSEDPFVTHEKPKCCSSILFIPGLEGSRLYSDESIFGSSLLTTTNTLWEPNRNGDVSKLYLNQNGLSINPSIYSGQPIDNISVSVGNVAWKFMEVYGDFMDHLNDLAKNGTINEWKAFGYDWRKPIADVVNGIEIKATSTKPLIEIVEDLAANSKTGKVSLIAHSNGGLVAKYLVKKLTDMGKESLIDSVVSVAVPYLGTPQAIAGLLHGDGQSMLGGLILKQSVARGLGENMASAYSLLPSKEYFSKVFSPTIAFAATTTAGINDGSYPMGVNTFSNQFAFITDANNVRANISATSSDVIQPIRGNKVLMNTADILHGMLDPFPWPVSISRWAILGWGLDTVRGVLYSDKTKCKNNVCVKNPVYEVVKNSMGDGTVVSPSAEYNAGTVAAVDLKSTSKVENKNINHTNILEASSTRTAIDAIITHNPADDKQEIIDKLKQIPGVTIGAPDFTKGELTQLILSTHSPVDLHVYDSKGRHTGIVPLPAGADVEEGLYTFTENNIPGSSVDLIEVNDNENDTHIYLPDDNGEKYSVVINGTGFGLFTFDVERMQKGKVIDKAEYAYMPTNPLTVATTNVTAMASESAVAPLLASSSIVLNIDIDGDGSADIIQATTTTEYDPLIYLESLKKTVSTLVGNLTKGKNIIKRIDKIENLIKNGKYKQADKAADNLDKKIGNMKFKKLSEKDKQMILDMIDAYVTNY